ncbi:MAG: hypothetical protein JO235_18065 [Chroococcidiopsidaceae cyanobacterium CP_BM_RX_35]|nr:hypothetical protein [Chroococcidiopsidaceae cyanobacterium CP_BM_RX_35]
MSISIPPSSKNLVIGLVKGYQFNQIKPFLISLGNCGYKGDICLLTASLSSETQINLQDHAAENGIILHSVQADEPFFKFPYIVKNSHLKLKEFHPFQLRKLPLFNYLYAKSIQFIAFLNKESSCTLKCHISKLFLYTWCVRYPLYYLYLSEYGKSYSNVMLTDTRDVLFQKDPFSFNINGLCCFLEENDFTINSSSVNRGWIIEGFGENALREIGHYSISCSGTTIGTRSAIMQYLETMVDYLIQISSQSVGIDQGVHNYILRKNLIKDVKFFENYHGPVLTMQLCQEKKFHFNQDGYITNEDGSIINVLHQYDRHSSAIKSKLRIYQESECVI